MPNTKIIIYNNQTLKLTIFPNKPIKAGELIIHVNDFNDIKDNGMINRSVIEGFEIDFKLLIFSLNQSTINQIGNTLTGYAPIKIEYFVDDNHSLENIIKNKIPE